MSKPQPLTRTGSTKSTTPAPVKRIGSARINREGEQKIAVKVAPPRPKPAAHAKDELAEREREAKEATVVTPVKDAQVYRGFAQEASDKTQAPATEQLFPKDSLKAFYDSLEVGRDSQIVEWLYHETYPKSAEKIQSDNLFKPTRATSAVYDGVLAAPDCPLALVFFSCTKVYAEGIGWEFPEKARYPRGMKKGEACARFRVRVPPPYLTDKYRMFLATSSDVIAPPEPTPPSDSAAAVPDVSATAAAQPKPLPASARSVVTVHILFVPSAPAAELEWCEKHLLPLDKKDNKLLVLAGGNSWRQSQTAVDPVTKAERRVHVVVAHAGSLPLPGVFVVGQVTHG